MKKCKRNNIAEQARITPKTIYEGKLCDKKFILPYNEEYIVKKFQEQGLTPQNKIDYLIAVFNYETYNDVYYFYTKTGVTIHSLWRAVMIFLFQKKYLKNINNRSVKNDK